ncbi:MAG TPA: hypothetical protein VF395_10525, partial [Polyangiaceae bacterium]
MSFWEDIESAYTIRAENSAGALLPGGLAQWKADFDAQVKGGRYVLEALEKEHQLDFWKKLDLLVATVQGYRPTAPGTVLAVGG